MITQTENGWVVEIFWFDEIDSTQRYLIDALKASILSVPVCIGADRQYDGKGSRGNSWIGTEGNLFISFAISKNDLPTDLRLESCSIYFAYLLKDILKNKGSNVWLKWPNDFYMGNEKIGGVITNLIGSTLVCGIGLNLGSSPEKFGRLDLDVSPYDITKEYMEALKKFPSWKDIFSKYQIEFEQSREFFSHYEGKAYELKNAILCEDGSLMCEGQRIYSLR